MAPTATAIEFAFAVLLLSLFRAASSSDDVVEIISGRTTASQEEAEEDVVSPDSDRVPSPSMSMSSLIASASSASGGGGGGGRRVLADGDADDGDDGDLSQPDGRCQVFAGTKPIEEAVSGQGIVFAIQSDDEDDDGLVIRSFGIHIDPGTVGEYTAMDYEVYALSSPGHYASTERDPDAAPSVSPAALDDFDYRGDLDQWDLVDSGSIFKGDLETSVTTLKVPAADFYEIPSGRFGVPVPANGGVRSFYIATTRSGLLYSDPVNNATVNDGVELIIKTRDDPYGNPPKLLMGEGLALYPMPDSDFFYIPKSFLGRIYYEKECPSPSPSLSLMPSNPPASPSQFPSYQPSVEGSEMPSHVPSAMPSHVPSVPPSEWRVVTNSGLLTKVYLDCAVGEPFPFEEGRYVAESVQNVAIDRGRDADPPIRNVNVKIVDAICVTARRRRGLFVDQGEGGVVEGEGDYSDHGRRLPTGSSAVDFSFVITGDYRPASRIGGRASPAADLGKLSEDSINRDPVAFTRDLKSRAGEASVFAEIEEDAIVAHSFEVEDDVDVVDLEIERFTIEPTTRPTSSPTFTPEDNLEATLLICIVITAGLIVLLGAFLFFRAAERRAARTRRKEVAAAEIKKERVKAERAKMARSMADAAAKAGVMGPYGVPPPMPNYYAGGPPMPNYGGGYGGPPPPYGQHYGGQPPPNHPYPPPYPPHPPPPGQGGGYYGRPHAPPPGTGEKQSVTWK